MIKERIRVCKNFKLSFTFISLIVSLVIILCVSTVTRAENNTDTPTIESTDAVVPFYITQHLEIDDYDTGVQVAELFSSVIPFDIDNQSEVERQKHIDHILRIDSFFDQIINRLEDILDRLNARTILMSDQGVNMTEHQLQLETLAVRLIDNRIRLTNLEQTINSRLTVDHPKDVWNSVRLDYNIVLKTLIDMHKSLRAIVKDLRTLDIDTIPEPPTKDES